jgi:hypothetical protein
MWFSGIFEFGWSTNCYYSIENIYTQHIIYVANNVWCKYVRIHIYVHIQLYIYIYIYKYSYIGCGLVEFSNSGEAQTAINNLNDRDLMGRQVFVREDRE